MSKRKQLCGPKLTESPQHSLPEKKNFSTPTLPTDCEPLPSSSQGLLGALPHTHGGVQGGQRGDSLRVQDALQEKHHLAPGALHGRSGALPRLAHAGPRPPAVPADPAAAPGGHPAEHLLRQEAARRVQVSLPRSVARVEGKRRKKAAFKHWF